MFSVQCLSVKSSSFESNTFRCQQNILRMKRENGWNQVSKVFNELSIHLGYLFRNLHLMDERTDEVLFMNSLEFSFSLRETAQCFYEATRVFPTSIRQQSISFFLNISFLLFSICLSNTFPPFVRFILSIS